MDTFKLNTIEEAIADFKEGKFITKTVRMKATSSRLRK